MANVTCSFTLDTEKDRRIIAWLDALGRGEKSAAIRAVLHAHLDGQTPITLGDVYQAVKAIDRKLTNGVVVANGSDAAGDVDEPADVAATLDGLGL